MARVKPAVLTPAERVARLPELRRVLTQLSPQLADVSDEELTERLYDDRLVLVVLLAEDVVVATATLSVLTTAGLGRVGHVDDVVVDDALRGQGAGRVLMEAVHEEARRLRLRHLDLTSRPSREAANALYRSMGYAQRDTNAYRLRMG